MSGRPAYPLSAIVGQDDLTEALLVCAVNPVVGGVLVRGERGTAKSTAVRALAPMLGSGAPLVELPLGATLDRLVGALDLRAALAGEHQVQTGLLGAAHGGVLYVDEVNLLGDHLVDVLLDAAASGTVTIERDGVSVTQDARFLLVGTMNPEEGELRPQLLDRFGLGVRVTGPRDPAVRAEIVRRRMAFDADPEAFVTAWADAEAELAARITRARELIGAVRLGERARLRISTVCAQLDLDGVRGDLVCAHAACALAALDGEVEVADAHLERAAHLALGHRLHRDPLGPPPGSGEDTGIDQALAESEPPQTPAASEIEGSTADGARGPSPEGGADAGGADVGGADGADAGGADAGRADGADADTRHADAAATDADSPPAERAQDGDRTGEPPASRPAVVPSPAPSRLPPDALRPPHVRSRRNAPAGRSSGGGLAVLDARPAHDDDPVAIHATVLAALRGDPRPHTAITGGGRGGVLCLIVDTSGSMGARSRLARVKGALEAALREAYARRDLVAVVAFSGNGARTLVAPGAPLEHAARAIRELPAGGRTPL
ncbi:MAG TPA: AAA family ATPase, partial [Solirubrobacteraceae bacterium]|nr:AAA family ATPase [Solirubrobacteraceae bacterium]